MKFSQLGQAALATAVSAALVLGITACGQSNTVDFVYVASASANPGNIYAYASDGESGALTQIKGSPFPAGRNPIALLTSPNNKFVYALNHDDNTITEYAAGSDGTLFAQNTYNPKSGTNPNGMALSPDGKTLYVVEAYGLGPGNIPYSATTPGIGALVTFAVDPVKGTLSAENAYPTCNNPVAVSAVADGKSVYVVDDPAGQLTSLIVTVAEQNQGATNSSTVTYPAVGNCSGGTNPVGQISSYVVSNGTLSEGSGSPFRAGVAPVGIATDQTSRFAYVIDYRQNQILSFSIQPNGGLEPLVVSTATTGNLPSAITIDPRGKFIYVSNYSSGTVSGYEIDQQKGVPSSLVGAGSIQTDPGPVAVHVENAIGRYVYTANFIGNSVSGLYLDPNAGTTSQVQNTPFPGAVKATAITSVKHGDHAIQLNASY